METFDKNLRPKVGVGVMVMKDGKVLLGKRKSSHGTGEYAWPGGHLEYMESFKKCAKREVFEETGMKISHIRFIRVFNFKDYAPKHYVHICVLADWQSGEPRAKEPEKCDKWAWYEFDDLPSPLFKSARGDIDAYRTGKNFYDA